MAKYVVSSTLTEPEWTNATVISGDPVAEIKRLKDEPGMSIVRAQDRSRHLDLRVRIATTRTTTPDTPHVRATRDAQGGRK
jgi:hypothetical protein